MCFQLTSDDNDLIPEAAVVRHDVGWERFVEGGVKDVKTEVPVMVRGASYRFIVEICSPHVEDRCGWATAHAELPQTRNPYLRGRCSSNLRMISLVICRGAEMRYMRRSIAGTIAPETHYACKVTTIHLTNKCIEIRSSSRCVNAKKRNSIAVTSFLH